MRVSLPRVAVRRILRGLQFATLALSLAFLSYCAFVLVDAWRFERNESQRLDRMLLAPPVTAQRVSVSVPVVLPASAPEPDGLIGRLEISRLGISVIVTEGTSSQVLRRAAGHIAGTRLPGENGNVGISAHRDTFFRPLRNVRQNDIVAMTTPSGSYQYKVVSTKIVPPEDTSVLNDSDSEVLTLVTCYPFYFVGAAPQRFIVRAERIQAQPE